MCKTFPFVYNSAKIIKIDQDFPKLWSQMFCHLYMVHSVILGHKRIHIPPWIVTWEAMCVTVIACRRWPLWHNKHVASTVQQSHSPIIIIRFCYFQKYLINIFHVNIGLRDVRVIALFTHADGSRLIAIIRVCDSVCMWTAEYEVTGSQNAKRRSSGYVGLQ